MPETREVEEYDNQGNVINRIPYEVSDEELQREADTRRLAEICNMAHSAMPVPILAEGFLLLCKKLDYV